MNIEQAKQIPIVDMLQRLGHAPHRQVRDQLWYFSPVRNEATPSFKVNPSANLWYDFGEGKGGDVIDLVMRLERLSSVSESLARITELAGKPLPPAPTRPSAAPSDPTPAIELTSIGPVRAKSLMAYLRKRGIDPRLAAPYVHEAHYRRGDKSYFALAFANDSGGYELRNPYFKGTLNAKDITVIPGDRDRVLVFEGFFDFLTAVTLSGGLPDATVLVLNSVSMQEKAAQRIRDIKPHVVELYRDRDPTGEKLLAFFRETLPDTEIEDRSGSYIGHKDLNDWMGTRHATVRR